jgi:DNA repair ATPase RecN
MVVICSYCNKEYASYSSRSNHIKKFHTNNKTQKPSKSEVSSSNITQNLTNQPQKNLICEYCKKDFSRKDNLTRHENNCKIKKENYNKLQKEIDELKEQNNQLKIQNEELSKLMKNIIKKVKINKDSLNKINNIINNTTNNTINNITNNTINNTINIVALGKENLSEVFTIQEKLNILKYGKQCFTKLIEYTHTNDKYPQFKNIMITNLKDKLGYIYNSSTNKFDAINKDELLNDIISEQSIYIYDFKWNCVSRNKNYSIRID